MDFNTESKNAIKISSGVKKWSCCRHPVNGTVCRYTLEYLQI